MLNTKKILFILPDVAYSAELLPDKKPLTFSIQSCIQVNGSLIKDTELNVTNLSKLFAKLDTGESYQVILPDSLFINTIKTIEQTGDAKIKQELKETILPELGIATETHEISSTVLNELRGKTRVQLSAIEKKLLAPLRVVASDAKVIIEQIAPLSWALKSIVSLEPSVVVLQLGANLYGSLHYIGVEQCFSASTENIKEIVDAITKLKKAEPSIMTCYLVSNELVESELKAGLKQVLPIQQMTESSKDQNKLPAAVSTIIEEATRTIAIADYPVPQFALDKPSIQEVEKYAAALSSAEAAPTTGDAMPDATRDETAQDEADQALPKPAVLATNPTVASEDISNKTDDTEKSGEDSPESDDSKDTSPKAIAGATPAVTPVVAAVSGATASGVSASTPVSTAEPVGVISSTVKNESKPTAAAQQQDAPPVGVINPVGSSTSEPAIDLRQFAGAQSGAATTSQPVKAAPIHNKSRSMTKMIIITLLVFIGTVAFGVGIGYLVLNYTSKPADTKPIIEVQPSPTRVPEVTPDTATDSAATSSASSATSSAVTDKEATTTVTATMGKMRLLVVNATTKAGYAGQIKDKLTAAAFTSITAANAKGTYTATTDLVYMKKSDDEALTAMEKATGLSLTVDDAAKQEDPQGSYDAIIVLNQ